MLKHYLANLVKTSIPVQGANAQTACDLTLNTPDDASVFKRVAHKVGGKVIRSAKQILMGSVPGPQTQSTFEQVCELVAAPVETDELLAIVHEIGEIRKNPAVSKCCPRD